MSKTVPYGPFVGLDNINEPTNMSDKYLVALEGGYVDIRGQINKAGGVKLYDGIDPTLVNLTSVKHYGGADALFFLKNGSNIDARTVSGKYLASAFSGDPIVDFTNYSNKIVCSVKGQEAVVFDGTSIANNSNIPQGGANTTILKRLAVSDIADQPTQVSLNKLDNIDVWDAFSDPAVATDSLIIDIKNQLSSKDKIKGLGVVEGDKLAIFCENETILYKADEDARVWQIIRDFRAPVGIFGRKTIQPVGTDLFFCSKVGVHSLKRAASGLTLETIILSRLVNNLFRELVESIPTDQEPRAVWNMNLGQYQVFFPTASGAWVKLIFTYEPSIGRAGFQSWAYTPAGTVSDASFFADQIIGASTTGLVNLDAAGTSTSFRALTPILWQGTPNVVKQYRRLYVRVEGSAVFTVNIYDEYGRLLQSTEHQPNPGETFSADVPQVAPQNPVSIPCRHRAHGLQIEFLSSDAGDLKILDFAIERGGR